eukprot:CAMPEP_0197849932 /NCGR_PEP_ID=MMETSP1438-20131217/13691_1 /TAXON_ID=1461541 /ORGANISM="Pterosperma sp., Strain CCMP1384" /LENGTH=167 /DNA_ID=CAMNT_0043462839 /DNA_START=241 /DNA_END=744 /DNA_ORIENTATION=-
MNGVGGTLPLEMPLSSSPIGTATAHDLEGVSRADVKLSERSYAPVKGDVNAHPRTNGKAVRNSSGVKTPSECEARPIAENTTSIATSPNANTALRLKASSTVSEPSSTFATPCSGVVLFSTDTSLIRGGLLGGTGLLVAAASGVGVPAESCPDTPARSESASARVGT